MNEKFCEDRFEERDGVIYMNDTIKLEGQGLVDYLQGYEKYWRNFNRKIKELEKENIRLKNTISEAVVIEGDLVDNISFSKLESLEKQNQDFREALGFYANEKNWVETYYGELYLEDGDSGEIARGALEKHKEVK